MPQFYFHIRNDEILFEDRRGGEFADLEAAWRWGIADVRAMIREVGINGHWIGYGW